MSKRGPAFLVAVLLLATSFFGGCSQSRDLPNIILISIDTVRADRLGCYGYDEYGKSTTPMMDQLAEKGVRFEHAYSTAPWTLPSHGSMMTGLYPSKHKAIDENLSLDEEIPMLAERLKKAGYETGGFVSHYYLSKDYGFDRGFDKYVMKLDAPAWEISDIAARWIKDNRKKNFFAFIHYFDPHTPYRPPLDFAKKYYPQDLGVINGDTKDVLSVIHSKSPEEREKLLRGLSALYDGEIDYVDSAIGQLYKKLQFYKLDQDTLIIVTSDHGEEFFEHGLMEHGFTLYEEQLHVPLIFHAPSKIAQGKTVATPVSLVDLASTIMDYAKLVPPRDVDGLSLLPFIKTESQGIPSSLENRQLQAQTTRQGPDRMCVIADQHKYIYSPEFELSFRKFGKELFDLAKDPAEKNNLAPVDPEMVQKYQDILNDSGMYAPKKVWHVRFAGTKEKHRYNGQVATMNRIIYAYKHNVIYDTDLDRKLVAREFPWKKKDSSLQYVAFGQDGENGFSFVTDPEDAKVNAYLYVETEVKPDKIALGSLDKHPEQVPFVLSGDLPKKADAPPPGGYLVWSDTEYVNNNILLRFEVGDQVQPSAEMRERLRSLGYLSGGNSEMKKQ